LTTATAAAPTPVAPTPRAASRETRPRRVRAAGSGAGPAGAGRSSVEETAGHGSSWVVSLGIAYSSWPFRGTFSAFFNLRGYAGVVRGPKVPRAPATRRAPRWRKGLRHGRRHA